ncbi:hypothetical protein F5X68DRAFT_251144 [Plectosphaerella plurivora]|uniref:Uncharacterized protein n=1 Tax=Plectosphaerella plurivora TaxID=936078 RepID=A0A9P9A4Z7_9PEZI|nr:hypothetical protein F5X68DRAFT_251144 [Plectosphaerella plurivora]
MRVHDLPVDVVCLILKKMDCGADLMNATHGSSALFRTFKHFEAEIASAVLSNQFTPDELGPLQAAVSLPSHATLDNDNYDALVATAKLSAFQRGENRAQQVYAVWPATTLILCRKIEKFYKAQERFAGWYVRHSVPAILQDEGNDTGDKMEPPTETERLRFLQGVYNIEIMRKLRGWTILGDPVSLCISPWPTYQGVLTRLFSFHDSMQVLTIAYFIRRKMRPFFKAALRHLERHQTLNSEGQQLSDSDDEAPGKIDLYRLQDLLDDPMYDEEIGGDEPSFLLSLGIETCVDIISEPKNPANFHYLGEPSWEDCVQVDVYSWENGGPWGNYEGVDYWGSENSDFLESLLTDASDDLPDDARYLAINRFLDTFLRDYAANTAIYLADKERISSIRSIYRPRVEYDG